MELNNRGTEEFKNNLYDSAEKDFKQAIQTDTTFDLAHYNLGKVYQKQRKWDKAAEALEAAAQLSPKNANYQYDLGEAYLEAKKIDQAEKALKAATEADPKLFKAHWRLGLVYKMLDQPKPADDELRAAIEANPRFSKSYVALGYLYLDYDFNKEASQVFQGCVTAKDDDGECHNGWGLALKNLKQYEQATGEFKKAIDLDPELYDALYNCGMAYADWYDEAHGNDQKDRAREYLQKFVTNGGKSADGNYVKAANDKLYALSGP
jgi:Tfp pilus assembly protein PilF